MTNKDAIDFINKKIQIDVQFLTDEEVKTTIEVLNMAIAALEKQDGKKPLNTDEYHPYYGCPDCKHIVSAVQDFCESCGQKILWE